MHKTKILHVISSLKLGGAEQVLYSILDSHKDNVEHEVVYFHDGPIREKIENLGIKTTKITGLIVNYDPVFLYRFFKKIVNFKPDLISSSLWAANLLSRISAKILNIPVINAIHALPIFEGKFRNKLDNISLNLATKIISVSNNISQELLAAKKIAPEKLETIQNGINILDLQEKFTNSNITKNSLGLTEKNIVIGTVGRFIGEKNQDKLIKAFSIVHKKNPDSRLLLVGVGPLEQNLRELTKELNLEKSVIFIVGQPAYKYLPIMDIFALPSRFEGLPIALLEAMTCKLSVIVTGKNKNHEVVQDLQTGLIIEADNIEQLSDSIIELILTPELKNKLAKKGQDLVKEKYNISLMSKKYQDLFNKLAEQKNL